MKKLLLIPLIATILGHYTALAGSVELDTGTGVIYGTLLVPSTAGAHDLVILHAGSGPTDRDCNSPLGVRTDAFKMLAQALCEEGYAVLRYDKRGIAQSAVAGRSEADLRIQHYADDLKGWVDKYYGDKRFGKIILAGHSEGSLIALMAAGGNHKVASVISLAGIGYPGDEILKTQLDKQLNPMIKVQVFAMIDKLKNGETIENVPDYLASLFRESVQPYMISWFAVDPAKSIARLEVPVLVINGTTDLQVSVDNAEVLYGSARNSSLVLIENMNHVLKQCDSDDPVAQQPTYMDPSIPLSSELVPAITKFLREQV